MDILPRLSAIIIFLLFMSAFFSGAEMALTSVSNVRLEGLAQKHPFLGKYVDWVSSNRYEAISAILIGNNLVNVASSAAATALCTVLLKNNGVPVAVLVMSVLIIIFGEVLPKCIAMAKSEYVLVFALPPVRLFSFIFKPLILLMEWSVSKIGKMTGANLSFDGSDVTREEIGEVLKIGEASGAIESTEREMIDSVISIDEVMVSELMVPRTKMFMLEAGVTVDEALVYIQQKGVSRVPIYTGNPDHINGIVLVKDLLTALTRGHRDDLAVGYMRRPLFVPETMYVPKLLKMMQTSRMHMALVVDEYGGTAGLITMEDILEEIVGEIQDEYDKEDLPISLQPDGSYKVQGEVTLEELNDAIGSDFDSTDVDTIGGLLIYAFGNFPSQGDSISLGGWTFVVSSMGEHKINAINAIKVQPLPEGGDDSGD